MQGAGEGSPQAAVLAAREALGLTRLEAFPVQHCAHAYGIVLESSSGWKVAVSGDTRPCPAVVEAALNATVLIHEVQRLIHFLSNSAGKTRERALRNLKESFRQWLVAPWHLFKQAVGCTVSSL